MTSNLNYSITKHRAEANVAFELALASGRLSHDRSAPNWVGHYMYMGLARDGRTDAFKHSLTRQYLAA
jgi:hypothetical protein